MFLVLSERVLHEGQNHLFFDDKISGFRNWLREVCMSVDTCRGIGRCYKTLWFFMY